MGLKTRGGSNPLICTTLEYNRSTMKRKEAAPITDPLARLCLTMIATTEGRGLNPELYGAVAVTNENGTPEIVGIGRSMRGLRDSPLLTQGTSFHAESVAAAVAEAAGCDPHYLFVYNTGGRIGGSFFVNTYEGNDPVEFSCSPCAHYLCSSSRNCWVCSF